MCRHRREGSNGDGGTFPPALLEGWGDEEKIPRRCMLQPEALVQSLAWRRAHLAGSSRGHISMAEEILCPSPKRGTAGSLARVLLPWLWLSPAPAPMGRETSYVAARRGEGFDTWAGPGNPNHPPWSCWWVSTPLRHFPKRLLCCGLEGALAVCGRVPCGKLLELSTAASSRIWP